MQGSNQGIAAEVSSTLNLSDDPLSFITNNLRPAVPVSATPADAATIISTNPDQPVEVKAPVIEPVVPPTPPVLETAVPKQEEPTVDSLLEGVGSKKTKEDSIKDLRKKAEDTQKKYEAVETEVSTLKEQLQKYESGEAVPAVVETYKSQIAELEKFRDLYDLESSPDYIKKYVEPIQTTKEKLNPILEEYGVPYEALEEVFLSGSEKQLNTFLTQHFDGVAAGEIKGFLSGIRQLRVEGENAKKAPKESLTRLLADTEAINHQKNIERAGKIDRSARISWEKSLGKLQAEGKYPELVLKGDPEHDHYSRPIVENSAKEFGVLVTWLANNGLSDLPEEIAGILATRFALSDAAAIMAESRSQMFNEYDKVVTKAKATNRFENPPVGGGFFRGGGAPPPQQKMPDSPMAAGQFILDKIGISK